MHIEYVPSTLVWGVELGGGDKQGSKGERHAICKVITIVGAVVVAVLFYKFYSSFLATPDLPEFDLNVWWGRNTSNGQDTSIRPYRILFSDSMQENLRRKMEAYRRATRVKSLEDDSTYGINYDVLGQIFAHWQFKYKYGSRVKYLNQYNHYITNVQGLDIHFMRIKPKNTENLKVVPLLLIHGWPSSVRDFYGIIPLLTSAKPEYNFVFEVIAPSLPGFAFSQAPVRPGLTTYQMAIVLRNLMERIGHKQFYVHGGDIGHAIGSHIATLFPNQVLGFHSSTPVNPSKLAHLTLMLGAICPKCVANDLVDKIYPYTDKLQFYLEESGYLHLQSTKPDTVGIALQDSPLGLASYIIEKYLLFTDPANKYTHDGGLSAFNVTDLMDNVLIYWSTGSITTSLRLYKESILNYEMEETLSSIPTSVPTWGLRTKYDLIQQPDFILRWKYPNLVRTTNLDVGGHFAAFEKPVEVSSDIFEAVKFFSTMKK
ncbi:juvenile hormone epoxide hydrolase-like [Vanessa atalanta]|uniref:juvenile hormone epoxide hydrolase-like n=1 Tax=Vanessa atalanta TaxID=42275 RepID=UPI001FCCD25E|nr:juvenile hormone epoxide hydrolase-like [Vanessa atalanta]